MKRKRKPDPVIVQQVCKLPPDDFCYWWNPTGVSEPSGASVGGHEDAERIWARKDTEGKWRRKRYGMTCIVAWLHKPYRDQWKAWVEAGRPESKSFVSISAGGVSALELAQLINKIAKPVPGASLGDIQRERLAAGDKNVKLIEPLDEK